MEDGGINDAFGMRTNGYMVQKTIKTQIFHVANIQSLLTKTETWEMGMFVRKIIK